MKEKLDSYIRQDNQLKRVGIVTFDNEVKILGDGRNEPIVINGSTLNDLSALKQIKLPKLASVSQASDNLTNLIQKYRTFFYL